MKKYNLLIIGLLAVVTAMAQPEAVFDKIVKQYTWNRDGSMTFRYRKELKLNTHFAFNNLYGETFIVYNPEFQTLKINESYTKQADGTVIRTPDNAFNEVLPSFAADAPAYNHLKEMVVTHTGLEIGATIYLDYTITTHVGFYPFLDVAEQLQEHSPVKDYQVAITLPEEEKLTYGVNALKGELAVRQHSGMTTYAWHFQHIPAFPMESYTAGKASPMLFASNAEGENGVAWLSAMKVDPEACASLVSNLLAGKQTTDEKRSEILRYVVDEIATVRLPILLSAKIRPPAEVLQSAYGSPSEKATLLASMLLAAGLDAQIMMSFPSFATPIAVHAISDIRVKSGDRYLSPLRKDAPDPALRAQRDQFWQTGENGVGLIQLEERHQTIDCQAQIALNDTLANVTGTLINSEDAAAKPDFSRQERLRAVSGYTLYTLPSTDKGIDAWRLRLNSTRTQPMELPNRIKESCSYTLAVDGWEVETRPFRKEISNAVGNVSLTMHREDNRLIIRREIELQKSIIEPDEYPAFRTLVLLWKNDAFRTLILKKK